MQTIRNVASILARPFAKFGNKNTSDVPLEESSSEVHSVKYRLSHKFVINDFSWFIAVDSKPASNDSHHKYPSICSEPFFPRQDPQLAFKLQVYPKGSGHESWEHVSVHVIRVSPATDKVVAKFTISILNAKKEKTKSYASEYRYFDADSTSWEIDQFISLDYLLNPANHLLQKDQMTIYCEVDILASRIIKSVFNLGDLKPVAAQQNIDTLGALLKSGKHSDVIFEVQGKELKAHKGILVAHSDVFEAMFEHDFIEKLGSRVEITDISLGAFEQMLHFMYTGSITRMEEHAEELLGAADKYGLDMLKQMSGRSLCTKVTTKSVVKLFQLADRHRVTELMTTCLDYIRGHSAEVMDTRDWKLIEKNLLVAAFCPQSNKL